MVPVILTLGNMLVEVMRPERDQPLDRPGALMGPFPSGDMPIYASSVARLGGAARFVGVVGADAFGACLLARLAADGVDIRAVRTTTSAATGVAFVAYRGDGQRQFIFHLRDSACAQLAPEQIDATVMDGVRWLHLSSISLSLSPGGRAAALRALALLPAAAVVSVDPNLRTDLFDVAELRDLCAVLLDRADVIVPSVGEAALLADAATDELACARWAAQGKLVVLKLGAAGCRLYRHGAAETIPGFPSSEVDPTGAGDTFCAALSLALLEGAGPAVACRFANAAGALAVRALGPMEGAPTRAAVMALLHGAQGQR
jgi:sugar/nucleoside kinase (ribokinase family)